MQRSGLLKTEKITACIIGMMMFFVVLFSVFYIAHEANHDCTGEDCPICACVAKCEKALQRIGAGAAAKAAVILPEFHVVLTPVLLGSFCFLQTPVSRKVRLNN